MIKYAIVDDEPIAHRIIEGFADKVSQLEKVGNCYDAFEALDLLRLKKVDLLFLDINMPKLSGFEFLNTLAKRPQIIITSAYKEFALEGYEFAVADYLLKPFSFERFIRAVNKVFDSDGQVIGYNADTLVDHIFIKADKKQYRVLLNDIIYVEAAGNYSKVVLENETIITLKKISDFEKMLSDNFIRIHNSFIVAKNKIKVIEGNQIYLGKHQVPIGQTYRNAIKKIN